MMTRRFTRPFGEVEQAATRHTDRSARFEVSSGQLETRDMQLRRSDGFTLIELLIVVAIIAVIAAIAVPALLRARMAGNEASAIGSLRAINSAESTYASSCGSEGYAQALEDLVKPPSGSPEGFVSPDLSSNGVVKSGFVVNLQADTGAVKVTDKTSTCNGAANDAMSAYFSEAHPVAVGSTGQRSFATDTRRTIYFLAPGATITPGMGSASPLQ